ncbi:MAG: spore cortex biosynthesis protein YabQ [Firmicutes bacterium]|nr:spore cortex biosynthesis protein YabQ [Bacillota bacterium]
MMWAISGQGWLFISTVVAGAAIGLFYDFFRIIRRVAAHSAWVVQLEDVIFWVFATAAMFYFMLNRNFGEIRFFAVIGTACGVMLYFAAISAAVLKVSVTAINFLKQVITAAIRIITLPLRFIYNLAAPPTRNFMAKRHKNLRNVARYGKIQMKKTMRSWFILRKKV